MIAKMSNFNFERAHWFRADFQALLCAYKEMYDRKMIEAK